LKKDLTDEDKNYLDASLVECYGKFGITFDNASLFDEESGALKRMPTLSDWYATLAGKSETKHLSVVLTRLVSGSAAAMGGETNVNLNNKSHVRSPPACRRPHPARYLLATDLAKDLIMDAGAALSG
jgi:hypothetical protein